MRQLIFNVFILFSSFCFAQNTGSVSGMVLDGEMDNAPLKLANIWVEGTSLSASTDENGYFLLDNLTTGSNTIVFSFVGYESKEMKVFVKPNKPTNVDISLIASSISINNLAELLSSNKTTAIKEDKASI